MKASDYAFVYIDFNLMVGMTEQAFYELILRSARAALPDLDDQPQVRKRIDDAYHRVVDSSNLFLVPLGFNEGVMALCEGLSKPLVLLFDEFDGPFAAIDSRVFLNLRALRDRYDRQLCYVVATGKRLEEMRQGSEIGEFCEMFAHRALYLRPLNPQDTRQAVCAFMAGEDLIPTENDHRFVWEQAGGHPGLIEAVCHALVTIGGEQSDTEYSLVCEKLDSDPNVRRECIKLWNGLDEEQQDTLLAFCGGEGVHRARLTPLLQRGILRRADAIEVFCALFGGFVRRRRLLKSPYPPGVRVDVDAGEVWVDGRHVPTLTALEFRLLLLLYGRMGKICDKYQIVESVWGAEYIDQVDDARIEKLVSRLRKKIEPDPDAARYVLTVRGRGYRLAGS